MWIGENERCGAQAFCARNAVQCFLTRIPCPAFPAPALARSPKRGAFQGMLLEGGGWVLHRSPQGRADAGGGAGRWLRVWRAVAPSVAQPDQPLIESGSMSLALGAGLWALLDRHWGGEAMPTLRRDWVRLTAHSRRRQGNLKLQCRLGEKMCATIARRTKVGEWVRRNT